MIGDCHCVALVSRAGSIDWCCMPRIDDDSLFGRLLDWNKGGFCAITPVDPGYTSTRRYLPGTMMLETCFRTSQGEVMLYDFFAMEDDALEHPRFDHVRIVDGITGEVELNVDICPRFDYGEIIPRMRSHDSGAYTAIGSNKGLIICCNVPLDVVEHRDLSTTMRVSKGQRIRLMLEFQLPELIEAAIAGGLPDAARIDRAFEHTQAWWTDWAGRIRAPFEVDEQTLRSAITLKSLTFERTGAIAAAATTSLPESIGGQRNWDYRFSWIRDSVFTVRVLHDLGYVREADRFHQFIERSSAGSADELQIMYGVDGKRRLTEIELDWLEGYRQSRPVRIGNGAAKQLQMDIFGELVEMAWQWHASGHPTEPDYWTFLVDVIDAVCERWQERDHGIWEVRAAPAHYVHSKVMCWAALNHGIQLAQDNSFEAPVEHWTRSRDLLRQAVETSGYDPERGVFVQTFDNRYLDAALLLMPRVGFIAYDDPRMLRTTDAICSELDRKGLLVRYNSPDNLPGTEGVFLPCTFWLVACLACQHQRERAWQYYERALGCANDVGLFSEEFDVDHRLMLGNFPQGLTHVSQITARLALAAMEGSC
ncbi:glycoside hydrolase family 15 protein [Noviherbaspirillum saxi]|uniref:Glycoside hydrolase family 15 protein n=2 Tax=Noviherbaspirillum saxi TaxID=2320863 RepID=A0A3A3FL98_9BURK|nr:glycoside hydrolase family 15 protein [Noviherbaspirillum saxi]